MEIPIAISLLALLISLVNFHKLEKHRRAIFSVSLDLKIRKKVTNDGFELRIDNKSQFEVDIIEIQYFRNKQSIFSKTNFSKTKPLKLFSEGFRQIDIFPLNASDKQLTQVKPTERISLTVKILCSSFYSGKKILIIET